MKAPRLMTTVGVVALAVGGLAIGLPGASASPIAASHGAQPDVRACSAKVAPGYATCEAVRGAGFNSTLTGPPTTALTPAELQDAYNLTGLKSNSTVAIVDAYGYPNLAADLATFRSYFKESACTTKNGCLTIVNQTGGSQLPAFNLGWATEQALDVDAVSSACPTCKILMVETTTNSFKNLGAGVNYAATVKGVAAISNSYASGNGSDGSDKKFGKFYNHSGIAVVAATGDGGYLGSAYPADSHYVTAAGGTSLSKSSDARGWTETAWSGAGSGCSTKNKSFKLQEKVNTGCGKFRGIADVSAAADPNVGGLAWYGPISETESVWSQYGGTSEATPIISSVYALSGNTKGYANQIPYANQKDLYDITSGSNGSCSPSQLCNAGPGWDGPTGLGTPDGVKGF